MTCAHPTAIATKPEVDVWICKNCWGIYRAVTPECPKVFIKCKEARQVATARKVG